MDIVVDWGLTMSFRDNNYNHQWISRSKMRERIASCFPVDNFDESRGNDRYMFLGMNEKRVGISDVGTSDIGISNDENNGEERPLCWLRFLFSQMMTFPSPHNTIRINTIRQLLELDSKDKTMFEKSFSCLSRVTDSLLLKNTEQSLRNLRGLYNAFMKRNVSLESFPALQFLQNKDPDAVHLDTKMALLAIAIVDTFKECGQGRLKFFDMYNFGDHRNLQHKTQHHNDDDVRDPLQWSIPEWIRCIQSIWNASKKTVVEDDLQIYMSIFILCFLVDMDKNVDLDMDDRDDDTSISRAFSCRTCGSCCPFTRYKVNRKIYKMIHTRWCSNLKLFWVRESSYNVKKRAFEFLDRHFQILVSSSSLPTTNTKHACPCPILQHRLVPLPLWEDMRSLLIRLPGFGGDTIVNYSCCWSYIRWYSLYPHPQIYRPLFRPIVILQDRFVGEQLEIQCWMSYPKKEMEKIRSLFKDLQGDGFWNYEILKRVQGEVSQYKKDFLHKDITEIVAYRPGNEGYLQLLEKNTKLFAQWTTSR